MSRPGTFIIMGVSGSGKSLIGGKLAEALGADFEDGDDFHPAANKAKMSEKIPLTDEDRWPWLRAMRARIEEKQTAGRSYVLACSALKAVYRELLSGGDPRSVVEFVFLKGSPELIAGRMAARKGHFFQGVSTTAQAAGGKAAPTLLDSQFATLEEPKAEGAMIVNVDQTPDEIVGDILRNLG
ncbi:gluconokinase [Verrucomicrobium spinosum]|uniref:gluconokinase n=2 Tax=Verrucomicrobium spinosum TaxID=2736 RepID=UPI0005C56ECA|nr:gluconokinase [Verrucomicrobium spinosum]